MANLYADQVAGVQSRIQGIKENKINDYNDMANTITSQYESKLEGYSTKWKSVQDAGAEDLAAIVGTKGIYGAGKKVYDIYKKAKNKGDAKPKEPEEDGAADEIPGQPQHGDFGEGFEVDDPADVPGTIDASISASNAGASGGAASASGAGVGDAAGSLRVPSANALGKRRAKIQPDEDEPDLGGPAPGPLTDVQPSTTNLATGRQELDTSAGEFEDGTTSMQTGGTSLSSLRGAASNDEQTIESIGSKLYNKFGQSGRNMAAKAKNFFSKSGKDDAGAGESGTEAAIEGGGEAAGEGAAAFGTSEAVLGAIPVVGEIALAVGGLVAIGDGIYHLFHHPKEAPSNPVSAPVNIPQALTAKFSSALPSTDNATDRSASMSSF